VTKAPWEYLFLTFNSDNFPDLFHPTWLAAAGLLIVLAILYNVRTRALRRHPPYLDMWEWLWWTGLITFSLLIIEALFIFTFFIVLVTEIVGLATLVWIRFIRFPPFLAAYETKLAKERYMRSRKFADPEATIKRKQAASGGSGRGGGRPRGRQQRRRR
jgi:hypothetical protein